MPVYEFACPLCGEHVDVIRPMNLSACTEFCPKCMFKMDRVYHAPALLNRQKPGTFRFDPCRLNAWDDRLAHLKDVEEKHGDAGLRKVRRDVGEALYHETLAHKKREYG